MTNLFRFRSPLKRNVRRVLIVVTLTMLTLYLGLALYGGRFSWEGLLLLFLFWLFVSRLCYSTSIVMSTSYPFRSRKERRLDERQESLLNQAYRLAYFVAVPLALVILLVDFFGFGDTQTFYNNLGGITSILIYANFCLIATLPMMYIAWLEPDPIQEGTAYSVKKGSTT